jgi:hypothetical protein
VRNKGGVTSVAERQASTLTSNLETRKKETYTKGIVSLRIKVITFCAKPIFWRSRSYIEFSRFLREFQRRLGLIPKVVSM